MSHYDQIGLNYNAQRCADVRLVDRMLSLLNLEPGKALLDLGAGTGNYSYEFAQRGLKVKAVEPSKQMRKQAKPHPGIIWYDAFAEDLPFQDDSVDALVCMLASHHFTDLDQALRECKRVCPNGPVVYFTFDYDLCQDYWFEDYFPEIWSTESQKFPKLSELLQQGERIFERPTSYQLFPLPADFQDMNMLSPWNRPEIYLDPEFRQGTSGFSLAEPSGVERGLEKLKRELENGDWDKKYGELRKRSEIENGYFFLIY
jgi:ubiquinone/menaquinone biosynthesis C-methylase UbiE